MSEAKYERAADGKIYQVTVNPDTLQEEYTAVQAEGFEISPDGKSLTPIRSVEERRRQADPSSHLQHFKQQPKMSLMDEKQALRRNAEFQKQFEEAVLSRPKDVSGPNIRRITEKEWMEMRTDPEFQPLTSYQHKLKTPSGAIVRPILGGEVGMYREKICILEDGEKFFLSGELNNGGK